MPSASNFPPPGFERLTPRERECLRLVAQHLSSKQIARELAVSQHTVDGHLNEARRKLGAATRRDAARILLEAEDGSPLIGLGGRFDGGGVEDAPSTESPHPPLLSPLPPKEGGRSPVVAVSSGPMSAAASLDVVEDFLAPAFPAAPAQAPDFQPGPKSVAEPPGSAGPQPAYAQLGRAPRHELTPPQRLMAVVVIATVSALLLLLLLFGVQELTQLFEQMTEEG